jgi:tetrapyrrole methylase family protein/MazG family protein/ATP diphosphatase
MDKTDDSFSKLLTTIRKLRAPGGCPWDRKQKPEDVKTYLVDELYEVLEAIDRDEQNLLKEEIGDLFFLILFLIHIYEERNAFTLQAVMEGIIRKMIHRHPHVFGDTEISSVEEVKANWQTLKEKEGKPPKKHLLDGIPHNIPALYRSFRLSLKASTVGFDWQTPREVLQKVKEEINELEKVLDGDGEKQEQELGDLLFSIANLSRHLGFEPEQALRKCNEKFVRRFAYLEQVLQKQQKSFQEVNLKEMDLLWEEAKSREKTE